MPTIEDHIQKQIQKCDSTIQSSRPYSGQYAPVYPPPSPIPPQLEEIWNNGVKALNNGSKDLEDNSITVGLESLKDAKNCFNQLKDYQTYSKANEYIEIIDKILLKYDFTEITNKMKNTSAKGDEYFKQQKYQLAKTEYEKCVDYYKEIENNCI